MSIVLDSVKYYGSHLSDNIAETPEGYRICRNAVIGRSGFQTYLVKELTDPAGLCKDLARDAEVEVWRDPAEVFSTRTLASFEGKDFTIGHPDGLVDPDTHAQHSVGHLQNVRKGDEALDDGNWPLLADILVKGRQAIQAVDSGSRELSCGYSYELAREWNRFEQRNIVGNHVALVPKGRAGAEARINDAAASGEKKEMTLKERMKHILGLGFAAYAKDAKPEELAEVMSEIGKDSTPAVVVPPLTTKLISLGTKDGVEIYRLATANDSNPNEPNPAMDARKKFHDALDKKLDEEEAAAKEKADDETETMDAITNMFAKKEAEAVDGAHADDCDCAECKSVKDKKAADANGMNGPSATVQPPTTQDGEVTEPEPGINASETPQSQFDAAMTVIEVLKPFVAASKDKKLRAAFAIATKTVSTARDKAKAGSGGGYGAFRAAAQSVSVDAAGKFKESAQQKAARETDEMYQKEMKSRSAAFSGKK